MKNYLAFLLLLLLGLLLASPPPAAADCFAGHCRVSYASAPHYATAIVATPIAAVLVPSFSFQYMPAAQAVLPTQPAVARPSHPRVPAAAADNWPAAPVTFLASQQIRARGVLIAACAKCHSKPAKSGVDLFDGGGDLLPAANRQEILRQIEGDLMPPKAPLSPQQKDTLRAFLRG